MNPVAQGDARGSEATVAIVGGGPVGLLFACMMARAGVGVRVFERRTARPAHSRAIGIHPPALEALDRVGVADAMVRAGVTIPGGRAYAGGRLLGTLSFARLPGAYPFVLSLPQAEAQHRLEACLARIAPGALRRGAPVVGITQDADAVTLRLAGGGRQRARLAVAADGHGSEVRDWLGLAFRGRSFPDRYLMADTVDTTPWGPEAVIFLTGGGVVESFPLPRGQRRWVAAASAAVPAEFGERARALERWVWQRVGLRAPAESMTMVSAFGAEVRSPQRWSSGRVVLLGDAAHVLPPFGGQGMNLGWLDAAALADALLRHGIERSSAAEVAAVLRAFERARRPAARAAARRAVANLRLGRSGALAPLRDLAVRVALRPPLAGVVARAFTMRDLARVPWPPMPAASGARGEPLA